MVGYELLPKTWH